MPTPGNLDVLCSCGRMLHVPVDVRTVRHSNGTLEMRLDIDRGYIHAHAATWHNDGPNGGGEPHDLLELQAA